MVDDSFIKAHFDICSAKWGSIHHYHRISSVLVYRHWICIWDSLATKSDDQGRPTRTRLMFCLTSIETSWKKWAWSEVRRWIDLKISMAAKLSQFCFITGCKTNRNNLPFFSLDIGQMLDVSGPTRDFLIMRCLRKFPKCPPFLKGVKAKRPFFLSSPLFRNRRASNFPRC